MRGSRLQSKKKDCSGFVLVLVLMTILLVAITVASFSSYSLKSATHAMLRHREMKQRWGMTSCQRAIMDVQRELSKREDFRSGGRNADPDASNRQPAKTVLRIELDGIEYMAVLSDESSKADLNSMLEVISASQVATFAETFFDRADIRVELEPLAGDQIELSPVFPPLQSWDQVVKSRDGRYLTPEEILRVTNDVTLWGGKLNYHRASDDVLRETIKAVAGAITADRLVSLRNHEPELSLPEVQSRLTLTESQRSRIGKVLSDRSSSQSVGIVSVDGHRVRHALLIRKTFAGGVERFYSLTW